jgi:hypothetical protein
MKGQEDRFSFSLGPVQGGGELRFPTNFFSHGGFSFSANAALDKIDKKVEWVFLRNQHFNLIIKDFGKIDNQIILWADSLFV